MKIQLTEQEMINIISTLSEQEIKFKHNGEFRKWNGEKNYTECCSEVYEFEYIYDSKGNLLRKFALHENDGVKTQ